MKYSLNYCEFKRVIVTSRSFSVSYIDSFGGLKYTNETNIYYNLRMSRFLKNQFEHCNGYYISKIFNKYE